MIMDRFRGRIAFPEYLSIGFNVFFTSWRRERYFKLAVDVSTAQKIRPKPQALEGNFQVADAWGP